MGRARSDAPRDPHPSPPHDAHAQPRPTSWLRGSSQGARTASCPKPRPVLGPRARSYRIRPPACCAPCASSCTSHTLGFLISEMRLKIDLLEPPGHREDGERKRAEDFLQQLAKRWRSKNAGPVFYDGVDDPSLQSTPSQRSLRTPNGSRGQRRHKTEASQCADLNKPCFTGRQGRCGGSSDLKPKSQSLEARVLVLSEASSQRPRISNATHKWPQTRRSPALLGGIPGQAAAPVPSPPASAESASER